MEALAQQAIERHWYKLHALLLRATLSPEEVVQRQCSLPGGPGAGVAVLATLPAEILLAETLRTSNPALVDLVGRLAALKRELIQGVDSTNRTYLQIWRVAIKEGGQPWLGIANPEQLFLKLLDALLNGNLESQDELLSLPLPPNVKILSYPRRAELWPRLNGPNRESLLRVAADEWLEALAAAGYDLPAPEQSLLLAVRKIAEPRLATRGAPAEMLLALVKLVPAISEHEFIPWLRASLLENKLSRDTARQIGLLCAQRRWKEAVRNVSVIRSMTRWDLDPLLAEAGHLMSWWERLSAPFYSRDLDWQSARSRHEALLEVAIELYGGGPMDNHLWERAGGKKKDLPDGRDGEERWRAALQAVDRGVSLDGGLRALVDVMLEDFPANEKLQGLRKLIW